MLLVREIMYCKPGKVREMVKKSLAMAALMEKAGQGQMKIMTDFCAERYWTIVTEYEVNSMQEFEASMRGEGITEEMGKEFEKIMEGYHDLVDHGRREMYKLER